MSVLNIILIAVIGGVTYLQMKQGFFSSLVMAVCTTFAAVLTMTCYEPIASVMHEMPFFTSIADGLSISLTFCLILYLLRIGSDKLIKADIFFGLWTERIAGGACGFITGLTMAGILAVVFQLMPFERSILGYEPYDKNLNRSEYLFPFYPDDYITGMWATVSAGSMSGDNSYTSMHEDLLLEAFCWRNRPAKSGSIHVLDSDVMREIKEVYTLKGTVLEDEEIDEKYRDISIRVSIKGSAMDTPDSESDDSKRKNRGGKTSWWRLPATHFRLRCKTKSGEYKSFYPSGYIFFDGETPVLEIGKDRTGLAVVRNFFAAAYDKPENEKKRIVLSSDKTFLRVDWVYRIPVDCKPETMIFRRVARADIDIEYEPKKEPDQQNQLKSVPLKTEEFIKYALKVKPPDRY